MFWWERNNLRLIQTNLREVDAKMDVDQLVSDLKGFSANTLMMNAGGIFAFYPTELKYHYRTPYLQNDVLREVIDKTHNANMKFIARFDFSKAHESIFESKPEWFFRTKENKEVNYDGIIHTCINGHYQQEYSLKMIEEVITNYEVDGIFFNMFGYITRDYSGNDYGICHCENCKKRFKKMFNRDLPESSDPLDKTYIKYKQFQWITTQEMLQRIYTLVKGINPNIAISTYNDHCVDIIRKESNTKLDRPKPVWLYSASENVKSVEDTWDHKIISNCSINAVDLQYRFMGVSAEEMKIRLYESIASGSGLDFCIIGVFDEYTDKGNFPIVKEIFKFHQDNEEYFGQLSSIADVGLIKPYGAQLSDNKEYRGIFKMLKEEHVQFDVICQQELIKKEKDLLKLRLLIIPNILEWDPDQLDTFIKLQKQGVNIISTGKSFTNLGQEKVLNSLFDAEYLTSTKDTDAAYLQVNNKNVFPEFMDGEWVFITERFSFIKFGSNVQNMLPYITPSTFGPPERAYNHEVSHYYGLGLSRANDGVGAYFPWEPGELYLEYGFKEHKQLLMDVIGEVLEHKWVIQTNADSNIEIFSNRLNNGNYFIQMLNLSGFNGVTYNKPTPTKPFQIYLEFMKKPKKIFSLKENKEIDFIVDDQIGRIEIGIDKLIDYEGIVLEM